MNPEFVERLYLKHQECPSCPTKDEVIGFFEKLLGVLFPIYSKQDFNSVRALDFYMINLKEELYEILYAKPNEEGLRAENNTQLFFDALPALYGLLRMDISAMYEGDPAAKSEDEIIRTYPGFYAIAAYRIAHYLHGLGVLVIPRMITEHAHSLTGVDIHPGATIGTHFCIDHGTGVVIGETAHLGNHVKIYQGVTLGALSVNKSDAQLKRHPTLEDNVVVYAGATILGGKTVVGAHSIIGGNVWLTQSVPAHSKIYYKSQMQHGEEDVLDTIVYKNFEKR